MFTLKDVKVQLFQLKNIIVPPGTFGRGRRARRTEWCALLIFLAVWIPLYIMLIILVIILIRTGWIESMYFQTAFVESFYAPSLIFCPTSISCGITVETENNSWSPILSESEKTWDSVTMESGLSKRYSSLLPDGFLNVTYKSDGLIGFKRQTIDSKILSVCGCGKCLCFSPYDLTLPLLNHEKINYIENNKKAYNSTYFDKIIQWLSKLFLHRRKLLNDKNELSLIFMRLLSKQGSERSHNQGELTIEGYFNLHLSNDNFDTNFILQDSSTLRIGLYGRRVPITLSGVPERSSWAYLNINSATSMGVSLTRSRLYVESFWSLISSVFYLWAPFLVEHKRYHSKTNKAYDEHEEYRLVMSPFLSNYKQTSYRLNIDGKKKGKKYVTLNNTVLKIYPSTFFQVEHTRIGRVLSAFASLLLVGILLVLVHRIGAFFVCFQRHRSHSVRLTVNPIIKFLTRQNISENHKTK